jgi:hypothetical protein
MARGVAATSADLEKVALLLIGGCVFAAAKVTTLSNRMVQRLRQ